MSDAAAVIAARKPGFTPKVGLVLGSGLGGLADVITDATSIAYADLPGFPQPSVAGHGGALHLGSLAGAPVACLQGRAHAYEGRGTGAMNTAVRTLKAIGCEVLVLTNAAGSLRPQMGPGSLMMFTDHINFTGMNPLAGDADGGPFVDLVAAYDPVLRAALQEAASRSGVTLHEGVYIWFTGPSFETPAEIRAARTLGADAVGMSTVPEVIVARQAGLRVAAISMITNLAAGMSTEALSHAHTMEQAAKAANALQRIIAAFLPEFNAQ